MISLIDQSFVSFRGEVNFYFLEFFLNLLKWDNVFLNICLCLKYFCFLVMYIDVQIKFFVVLLFISL